MERRFYKPIFKKEGIQLSDFNNCILQIYAHKRKSLFFPKEFDYRIINDKVKIFFELNKGQYASLVLNFLVRNAKKKLN